jgi:hypothetical protein
MKVGNYDIPFIDSLNSKRGKKNNVSKYSALFMSVLLQKIETYFEHCLLEI